MQATTKTYNTSQTDRQTEDRRTVDLALIFVHGDGRRFNEDRRQKSVPVTVDRRSGSDRRAAEDRRGTAQPQHSDRHHLN